MAYVKTPYCHGRGRGEAGCLGSWSMVENVRGTGHLLVPEDRPGTSPKVCLRAPAGGQKCLENALLVPGTHPGLRQRLYVHESTE